MDADKETIEINKPTNDLSSSSMIPESSILKQKLTQDLHQLTLRPEFTRNDSWEIEFFKALTIGNLDILSMDPQYGPDGWPYLYTKTAENSEESFQKILHWLVKRGIGLAINPQKKMPDYIFTYGMLWFFKETGYFYLPTPKNEAVKTTDLSKTADANKAQKLETINSEIKKFGPPSEAYLPAYVQKIIREFLQQQGILLPKILMISLDDKNYDLVFSLESLGNPPASEHQSICESIGWFLPPHYTLMLVSEKTLPPFQAL